MYKHIKRSYLCSEGPLIEPVETNEKDKEDHRALKKEKTKKEEVTFCELCQTEFTQILKHLNSQKHKKNEEEFTARYMVNLRSTRKSLAHPFTMFHRNKRIAKIRFLSSIYHFS